MKVNFAVISSIGVFLLFLCSCSPNSCQEFQQEGEARCRLLVATLQSIENREQLLLAESTLKKHFEKLIDLMIEAREFQEKLEEVPTGETLSGNSMNTLLELELRRTYMIEGGREIIERTQQEALVRLDAYERALAKKREQLTASAHKIEVNGGPKERDPHLSRFHGHRF
jgi:hypothetical protein